MTSIKWQDFLDVLTRKGIDTKVIDQVKRAALEEKFKLCYESNKSYLEEWLVGKTYIEPKSANESVKYRLEGNKVYQKGKDQEALKIYNLSVGAAPQGTTEFALALANRSAVLLRLNYFEEGIRDIDLALQDGNKDIPTQKLLTRKALLLHKLDCSEESLNIIKTLYPNEDEIKKLDNDDLKNVYHDLLSKKTSEKVSTEEKRLPQPAGGENETFSSASAKVSLKHTEEKGRHVMAREDLDIGDIIFVEKPFALVVLPDQYDRHCHHCCKKSAAFIPCQQCRRAQFCSEVCRVAAWEGYHRWECGGLAICHSIGIAHLGLRVALLADNSDRYKSVYDLVTHLPDMKDEDIYQYSLTAVLLTLYLAKYTSFFQDRPSTSVYAMGSRILRHIAQLICNGHAITKIDSDDKGKGNFTTTETQARIATAIYPSASMMNHSCDQNISNSFINQVLVVRASKHIKKGEEVFNCYGPHYTSMTRKERQKSLMEQYFFSCRCHKCSNKSSDLDLRQFSAFRCSFCAGPVMSGEGECFECGRPQMLVELANMALTAQQGCHEGDRLLDKKEHEKAVEVLEKTVALATKCLYKHNSDLRTYKDSLAHAHAELGRFKESVAIVEDCLDSIEKQFGTYSIQLFSEFDKILGLIDMAKLTLLKEGKEDSPEYQKWKKMYNHYMEKLCECKKKGCIGEDRLGL